MIIFLDFLSILIQNDQYNYKKLKHGIILSARIDDNNLILHLYGVEI